MKLLIEHFNIDGDSALRIEDWYNGYLSNYGSTVNPDFRSKYNIWSVVNYLNNQKSGFKSYWENSNLTQVFDRTLIMNQKIRCVIEDLINNKNFYMEDLTTNFSIEDFFLLKEIIEKHDFKNLRYEGLNLLFSYVFASGYLTITNDENMYALPNNEIRHAFQRIMIFYYDQIFNISISELRTLTNELNSVFSEKDYKKIPDFFTKKFAPKFEALIKKLEVYSDINKQVPIIGAFGNEDLMDSLLNYISFQVVYANFATERYTKKLDGTKGRADILLSKNDKSIIMAIKYNNNEKKVEGKTDLEKKQVDEALQQAKSYLNLIEKSETKIFIGCNITSEKKVFISGEIIKGKESTKFNNLLISS